MGLLVECPECKRRNSHKEKNCKCGFALAKFSGRAWRYRPVVATDAWLRVSCINWVGQII